MLMFGPNPEHITPTPISR